MMNESKKMGCFWYYFQIKVDITLEYELLQNYKGKQENNFFWFKIF